MATGSTHGSMLFTPSQVNHSRRTINAPWEAPSPKTRPQVGRRVGSLVFTTKLFLFERGNFMSMRSQSPLIIFVGLVIRTASLKILVVGKIQ